MLKFEDLYQTWDIGAVDEFNILRKVRQVVFL